jgi:hypothetical protein
MFGVKVFILATRDMYAQVTAVLFEASVLPDEHENRDHHHAQDGVPRGHHHGEAGVT